MNALVAIALLLVVPTLYVQGGAVPQPTDGPTGAPGGAPTGAPGGAPGGQQNNGPPDGKPLNLAEFFKFLKEQGKHALGYATDLLEIGDIIGKPQLDEAALEKKIEEMEEAESVFDGIDDFLLKAIAAIYKKPPQKDGPPPLCGEFEAFVKQNSPLDPGAAPMIAADFLCIGNEIKTFFDEFQGPPSGPPDEVEDLRMLLRMVVKITSVHHAEQRFYDALEKAYPKPKEQEDDEGDEDDDKKREMKDELLTLLLKRVLANKPANKRSLGSLLTRK